MLPSLGVSKPAMQRKVVVLPQPLGPSSETNSPAATLSEIGPTTDWGVKRFTRLRISSSGVEPWSLSVVINATFARPRLVVAWRNEAAAGIRGLATMSPTRAHQQFHALSRMRRCKMLAPPLPTEGDMKAHRPTIMGTRYMIVACQYLAAEAGFQILNAGGNAIDAGVAAGIALGVVQPEYVNFAGVAPIIIYSAKEDRLVTIAGLGPWPKAVTRDYFQKHHGGRIPSGILRTVVPAAPDAWITALERFGTMSFGEVAASAISFARDGFPVYPLMSEVITEHEDEYRAFPTNVALYLPNGRPPQPGELFVQKALG